MKLLLLADEERKNEFLSLPPQVGCDVQWFDQLPVDLTGLQADLLVDFLFDNDPARITWLQQPAFSTVMVNWMAGGLPENLIRFNGWPGFTGKQVLETSCPHQPTRERADALAILISRKFEWIPETNGFVGPRIISAIINEAFLVLEEETGTEEGIDTAMKLGTNYPFGPFEWAKKIGYKNLLTLLEQRDREKPGQPVCITLKEKALAQ